MSLSFVIIEEGEKVGSSVNFIFYFHKALQKHVCQSYPVVLSSGGT